MSHGQVTRFQRLAERKVDELLAREGRSIDQREILGGGVPFYSSEHQTALKLSAGELTCWLFDDEASFSIGDCGGGVERADYDTDEELLDAYIRKITQGLRHTARRQADP